MSAPVGFEHKTTKKATVNPSLRDLAWAAGYLEGEGSFSTGGSGSKFQVTCGSVDKEPVDKLLQLFGGNLRLRKQSSPISKSPNWVWYACGSRARGIAMTLYTFMSKRRQQQIKKWLTL